MEEHPQRRIRSLPSVQEVRRIVNKGCGDRVLRCDRKHAPPPVANAVDLRRRKGTD